MTATEIKKTIELLEYLDGRGIVFEDEELVREALGEATESKVLDGAINKALEYYGNDIDDATDMLLGISFVAGEMEEKSVVEKIEKMIEQE